ncbi:hypothetical protein J6590_105133 [Homalodisca vitripennis]|nr:hypothetical protein J6590_105133 [Homalodisca vitripennis]
MDGEVGCPAVCLSAVSLRSLLVSLFSARRRDFKLLNPEHTSNTLYVLRNELNLSILQLSRRETNCIARRLIPWLGDDGDCGSKSGGNLGYSAKPQASPYTH